MKKRKDMIRIGFGSSILLLVFVVISFVSFAVLSLSSAITDKKLTEKISKKNISYYDACNLAQEQLAQADTVLQNAYRQSASEEEFYAVASKKSNFSIPVSEYQELYVEINHIYPAAPGDTFYTIDKWKLVNINTPKMDTTLPLLQ